MYDSILGTIIELLPGSITLDCNGVGYRLILPMSVTDKLEERQYKRFLVHHHLNINTGDSTLFAFEDEFQRGVFRALLNVKKIGPNTAMKILVAIDAKSLANMIRRRDVGALSKVRGLGAKSAEQCIVELHDKIDDFVTPSDSLAVVPQIRESAVRALTNLGVKRTDAIKQVQRAMKSFVVGPGEAPTVAAIVREVLGG